MKSYDTLVEELSEKANRISKENNITIFRSVFIVSEKIIDGIRKAMVVIEKNKTKTIRGMAMNEETIEESMIEMGRVMLMEDIKQKLLEH